MANLEAIWQYNPLWGEWHLQNRLGDDQESRVFLATRESAGRRMMSAIKWVSVEAYQQGNNALSCCLEEAHRLYDLRECSHVVRYEDHIFYQRGDGSGYDLFIRMEYLTPLKSWVIEKGITVGQIIALGLSMAIALELCEAKGFLHRDIKIDNIFVSQTGVFKLGDFGIASTKLDPETLKARGGSPLYLAPEVLSGSASTIQSDQYALGKTLFYLLRGRETPIAFSEAVLLGMDIDIDQVQGLKALLETSMALRPKDRYATMTGMKEALEEIQHQMKQSLKDVRLDAWGKKSLEKDVLRGSKGILKKMSVNEDLQGRIHAFWAPFSSGKTTLAANMAYALAHENKNLKVALLDFDFKQKTLFYHFPINFEHLGPKQRTMAYSRYALLIEALLHERFNGQLENWAFKFGNLDVFANHRDVVVNVSPETCMDLLKNALLHYDEVVIDLPADCSHILLQYLSAYPQSKRYFVLTPDLEFLNGPSHTCRRTQIWLDNSSSIIINKDTGFNQAHYLSYIQMISKKVNRITLIPEVYKDAVQAKYRGAMLYEFNKTYKQALNQLIGGLEY